MEIVREVLVAPAVDSHREIGRVARALRDIDGLVLAAAAPDGEVTIGYDPGREDVAEAVIAALAAIGCPIVDRRPG